TRVRHHMTPALLSRPVSMLTAREVFNFREALDDTEIMRGRVRDGLARAEGRLHPSTVNRIMTGLKAALTLAKVKDDNIRSDAAWRQKGLLHGGASRAREGVILKDDEVRALVAAAKEHEREFGVLVEVAAFTGARISQIARLKVRDLRPEFSRLD